MLWWSLHIFLLLIRRFLSGWIITWVEVIKESSTTFFILSWYDKIHLISLWKKIKCFLHGSAKNFLGTCQKFSVSLLLWKNSNYLQKLEYLSKCQKTIRQIAPIFVAFSEKLKFTLCKYLNVHLWLNSHFSAHLILKDMILFNL